MVENSYQAVAVIPTRAGSKRIFLTNIKLINNKSLIVYTIEAANPSNLFTDVIVSTDSEQIAEIAVSYGASVPFLRDKDLADDHTPVSVVSLNALEKEDPTGKDYKYVAQFLPNCPFRSSNDMQASFQQFIRIPRSVGSSVTDPFRGNDSRKRAEMVFINGESFNG